MVQQQQLVSGQGLALDLVNSTYIKGGTRGHLIDSVHTRELLADWCAQRAEKFKSVDSSRNFRDIEIEFVHSLRTAVRSALSKVVYEQRISSEDAQILSANARKATRSIIVTDQLIPSYTWSRSTVTDRVCTLIAEDAIRLLTEEREHLRACEAPGCIMFFVPSAGRRQWCSATCGNRARVARHQLGKEQSN